MHLIVGVRGAMAGLMAELVEDHVRTHLVDTDKHPGVLNAEAAKQLLEVVPLYLKSMSTRNERRTAITTCGPP
jgi:FrmR/RcnR family transcriptional regulator, repressor of frmRAB operon